MVNNEVTSPSSTSQLNSDNVYTSHKVSDHVNVAVSVQNSTSGNVRHQEAKNAGGTQNAVAPISLDKVNKDQFMKKQTNATMDNVSIHRNNNNGEGLDPTVSTEIQVVVSY